MRAAGVLPAPGGFGKRTKAEFEAAQAQIVEHLRSLPKGARVTTDEVRSLLKTTNRQAYDLLRGLRRLGRLASIMRRERRSRPSCGQFLATTKVCYWQLKA